MLTLADIGTSAVRIAFALALWGAGASAYAAWRRSVGWLASARAASLYVVIALLTADLAMIAALVTHDFSIAYVANNNARETPLLFTVASLWAALEGSILLWATVLAGATAYVAWRGTRSLPRLAATALAVLFVSLAFFLALVATPAADPFATLPPDEIPANGRGPNPLLQNHPLMALHPPLLYLGYVLFSIPFAYAIAALILGEAGDRWLVATRRSALAAWALLGLGLAAGGWWGYGILGWGGYWAWDPVENAALMPWLTATAYVHSVMVEEKRNLLRLWNLALVVGTYALTIFGTFLTRSGIVNSVHSFTQSAIGPPLLGYLAVVLILSLGLLAWRLLAREHASAIGAPVSREAMFLFQNVLFVTITFTILLGTLYPLVGEALSGVQLSIGSPYFERVGVPIGLAILFLMGVGPQLPWQGASRATLERQFIVPLCAAAAGALAGWLSGGSSAGELLAYALAAFVTATVVQEFVRGVRARRVLHGESPLPALVALLRRNGRRYGGYVVHLGIVVIAVAITASQNRVVAVERTIAPGQSITVGRYAIELVGLRRVAEPQRERLVADLQVGGTGSTTRVIAALEYYPNATQPIVSPGIAPRPDEDLYATVSAYDARSFAWATIRIRVIPLVSWIWLGAAIVGLGALVAALPPPRPRRVPLRAPALVVSEAE